MNKNFLVGGIVVLVLLAGGVWYAFMNKPVTMVEQPAVPVNTAPESVSPAPAAAGIMEVDYTNDGFSPATVTIKKGGMVKFVNKTSGPMSVASNPHPTHTDYPGFDQWKSDAKGTAEYSFTFDKVGTWGYHNHFNSSDTGTVIVTE